MEELWNDNEKKIKHYSSSHTTLLVGEGDFSFSACLAVAFGNASNILATSLDSKESLLRKYTRVSRNLEILELAGGRVVHEVDATTMSQRPLLYDKSFDRIVFNFPHAGFHFKEHDNIQIEHPNMVELRDVDVFVLNRLHQNVVRGFLRNAKEMVGANGEIHITHKTSHPFNKWEIVKLAKDEGLHLKESADFYLWEYPDYKNKRGDGRHSDCTFPVGACSTFNFVKFPHFF